MVPIYLDNNATTRLDHAAHRAMLPYLNGFVGNPSSLHKAGQDARRAVEAARSQVAALFDSKPADVVFTSGGTESIHLAVLGGLRRCGASGTLITSSVEHAAGMAVARRVEGDGHRVYRLPVDQRGTLLTDELDECLKERPGVFSMMWVNNETGVIHALEPIAMAARAAGFLVHIDAVQAAGKLSLAEASGWADMISISAHKIHGPQGVGALWLRPGLDIESLQQGGHQERGMRAGTENVAGIVGLGAAAALAIENMNHRGSIRQLRDHFEEQVCRRVPSATIIAADTPRVDNTVTISFEGLPAESILIGLSERGLYASSGSACSSGSIEPSHVLVAMGLPMSQVEGAVRFSLSHETDAAQIDAAVEIVSDVVSQLGLLLG